MLYITGQELTLRPAHSHPYLQIKITIFWPKRSSLGKKKLTAMFCLYTFEKLVIVLFTMSKVSISLVIYP